MKPKIAFFGSDEKSEIVLRVLQKDKRFEVAKAPPAHLLLTEIKKHLKKYEPEVGILASYGKILDKETLAIPQHGILNLHPSLLPKYRGSSPVPATILSGDQETGVSIIKMDEEVDHGPIVAQFKEKVRPDDTAQSLYQRLFRAGAEALVTILPAYLKGEIEARKQNHSKATFTQRLTRNDGKIDWKKSDEYLERFIRAMYPWPGAWAEVKMTCNTKQITRRLKIHKACLKNGKLVLDRVQLEGKKPVTWKQFKEGYPKAKIVK